jgi:hypothetical protein
MDEDRRGWLSVLGIAAGAGILLGPLDLAWQRLVPYPLADLGNSMAVWALGAFLLGAWVRGGLRRVEAERAGLLWAGPVRGGLLRAVIGASVLNLVGVEAYYLTAMIVQHDSAESLTSPSTLAWLVAAVVAGAVFGVGGAWSREARSWRRLAGRALPAAVFLAEAGTCFLQAGGADAAYRRERLQDTILYASIALGLAVIFGRTSRERVTVLTAGVALALPGLAALSLFMFLAV